MNRRQRLFILLLTILPVVMFLFFAALYILSQVSSVMTHLNVILVDEAGRQLRREVKAGRVAASPLGTATIHDVRIAVPG